MPIRLAPILVGVLAFGCGTPPTHSGEAVGGEAREPSRRAGGSTGEDWFAEIAQQAGLDFVHRNGASGHFYYPEILGPGLALFDYDNDTDLDVYLVQGGVPGGSEHGGAATQPSPDTSSMGRLFRNDLEVRADGTRSLRFTDVTRESAIRATRYGLGVAAGDVDNDGWIDLLLTNFGANQLLHNDGDGTFSDVTAQSGLTDDARFAVSAAFVDFDRDGWLDLYVANNVNYTIANETKCPNPAGRRDYCPPQIYGGRPDQLYRNQRNGSFADVTARALIGGRFGPALGVSTADFNGDGWIDVFVANDGEDNLLWINQRDGTLRESGLLAGVAVTAEGNAEASMGVDAGDFDNDGDEDLIITELTGEGSNLYVNDGTGKFRDASAASGLSALSLAYTGWGTAWVDFDNDGWLDTFAANGTIVANESEPRSPFPYDQRKVLFRNAGARRFEDVSSKAGAAFKPSESGRGAAFGDIDNDGDVDILVGNAAGPVRLLMNHVGNRQHWIGLRLVGRDAKRDMLGARVGVVRPDGQTLWRRVRSDGSYASANDPRVLVGLGESASPPRVRVIWPTGETEEWASVPVDRYTTLTQGQGK
jgi:enediyne biosynthesis protein E4